MLKKVYLKVLGTCKDLLEGLARTDLFTFIPMC